jgi:uncharacterized protein (TIGR03067 family)
MPRRRPREDDYDDDDIVPRTFKRNKKRARKSPGYLVPLLIGGSVLGLVALVGVVAAFVSATRSNGGGPAPPELQGTWKVVSIERNRTGTDGLPPDRVVFAGDVLTTHYANGARYNQPIRVNPNRDPKELDIIDKGFTYPAIYKIEGDTLTVCINEIFFSRPREFSGRGLSGSGGVVKYKRITP